MAWTATEMTEFERLVAAANSHFERFSKSSLHALIKLLKKTPAASADEVKSAIAAIPSNKKDTKYNAAINYLRINYPGVDAVVVGGYTYKGFTGVQDEKARLARAQLGVARCYELVTLCKTAVSKVVPDVATTGASATWPADKRKATELFQKWFDKGRRDSSVNRVRTVFNSMAESLRDNNWEIILYGTPEDPDPENMGPEIESAFAFVIPSQNAYRIYLGAQFWAGGNARIDIPTVTHAKVAETSDQWQAEKKTKTAMDAAIVTTLHELCHVRAISGGTAITDVKPNPYNLKTCMDRAANQYQLALTNAENYAQFASALLMQKHFF
jgi:hypothetical protein